MTLEDLISFFGLCYSGKAVNCVTELRFLSLPQAAATLSHLQYSGRVFSACLFSRHVKKEKE